MSEPIWTDERIKRQAIAYGGYISSVVKALTEVRDEYESAFTELKTENDRLTDLATKINADHLAIARLLSEAGYAAFGDRRGPGRNRVRAAGWLDAYRAEKREREERAEERRSQF